MTKEEVKEKIKPLFKIKNATKGQIEMAIERFESYELTNLLSSSKKIYESPEYIQVAVWALKQCLKGDK